MNEMVEIYAACITEYARRQPNGVLTGPFHTFGKDARDAFNLPYSEKIFEGALAKLREVRALSEYRTWGVQTFYKMDARLFDEMMQEVSPGTRKFTVANPALAASAITAVATPLFQRSPDILESYADLGPDYLASVLESYQNHLLNLEAEDEVGPEEDKVEDASVSEHLGPLQDIAVPASDRIVRLNDNERSAIDEAANQLSKSLQLENAIDGDSDLRDRFVAQISAARELIRAESVRSYLMYETLVRMLGVLIQKYQRHVIGAASQKLLDLIIQYILGK